MDFSQEFIAVRTRIEQSTPKEFSCSENVTVGGRMTALYARYENRAERKLFGLMPVSDAKTHAHEHRLLFAAPALDEAALQQWWAYGTALQEELVQADLDHSFSIITLLLVTEQVDKGVIRALKRMSSIKQYSGGQAGWSSVRVGVIDLTARKLLVSRDGGALRQVCAAVFEK